MILREAGRLETSISAAENAGLKPIVFLHYPPVYGGVECEELLNVLLENGIKKCYYGHLHGASHRRKIEGERDGTDFSLVAADYLRFVPKKICE